MATVTNTTIDTNGNIVVDVSSSADDSIALATAGTYSDKNIIFNIKALTNLVLQEKNVTSSTATQEVTADAEYDGLSKVNVEAMSIATQATPSVSIDSSGLITATATQTAGEDDSITLATAGTYSDKNIIFNITAFTNGDGAAPSAKWNDVTFIDYNGTVLYSYSLTEAQALTKLPALPSHDGLICQGWNWTLEAIKAFNRPVTVGAMYITDDGATRLHIRIATVGRMTVPLFIGQTVENGVSIDWGDGNAAETLAGTGNINTSHTYADPGDYVISLMPQDGCKLSFGNRSSSYSVMGPSGSNNTVYCNMLQKVYVGKNVTSIGNDAFQRCYSIASITIPNDITSIGNEAFMYCYSLASITIPTGVTNIGHYAFYGCYSLASITIPTDVTFISPYTFQNCYSLAIITIPTDVTNIGHYAFYGCYSLASITIPTGVTNINNSTFQNCYGMRYYDFSACTDIPTLQNTNAFSGIPSDCQILIPSALFDEWSAATNWNTYKSKMVSV